MTAHLSFSVWEPTLVANALATSVRRRGTARRQGEQLDGSSSASLPCASHTQTSELTVGSDAVSHHPCHDACEFEPFRLRVTSGVRRRRFAAGPALCTGAPGPAASHRPVTLRANCTTHRARLQLWPPRSLPPTPSGAHLPPPPSSRRIRAPSWRCSLAASAIGGSQSRGVTPRAAQMPPQ